MFFTVSQYHSYTARDRARLRQRRLRLPRTTPERTPTESANGRIRAADAVRVSIGLAKLGRAWSSLLDGRSARQVLDEELATIERRLAELAASSYRREAGGLLTHERF